MHVAPHSQQTQNPVKIQVWNDLLMKIKFSSGHGPSRIQGCGLLLMWFDDSPDDIHPIMKKVLKKHSRILWVARIVSFFNFNLSRSFLFVYNITLTCYVVYEKIWQGWTHLMWSSGVMTPASSFYQSMYSSVNSCSSSTNTVINQ